MTSILPASTAFLDRDFASIRARLIQLVESVFPQWTEHDVASFGDILLEMFAFVGDVLGFYQDRFIQETRITTATQRRSIINLARLLNYRLPGAQAATATITFDLDAPMQGAVTVPAGQVISTPIITNPTLFQLLAAVVIPPGATHAEGTVEHSQAQTKSVDASSLSGGTDVVLDRIPYLDGSALPTAGNGAFAEQPTLLSSGPTDRHFVVLVDQNDRATLRFGNGVNGMMPTGTIQIPYKTGGGAAGNVDPNTLRVLAGSISDTTGRPAHLTITNPKRAVGGIDRQTVAAAKLLIPQTVRAGKTCVARPDFEIHARELPSVARALMLTSNEDATIEENTGILYIVPAGGGVPTQPLLDAVLRQVTVVYPCTLTFSPRVQRPVYAPVSVSARVSLAPGTSAAAAQAVGAAIRARLATFFAITQPDGTPNLSIDFGYYLAANGGSASLAWSDIFNLVCTTPGVRKVEPYDLLLNHLPGDVRFGVQEFPVLGAVQLSSAAVGGGPL